jgi:hypothetical protein
MKNWKLISIIVFILFLTLSLNAQTTNPVTDDYKEVEIKGITFKWEIVGENINIILTAPTNGWVAVGFNPSKMMKDADILIGYVKNGEVFMEDHFGSGNTKHKADTDLGGTEDITVTGGSEMEEKTTLKFSIPLHSRDANDQRLEKGEEYKVIFAYGKKDDFIVILSE